MGRGWPRIFFFLSIFSVFLLSSFSQHRSGRVVNIEVLGAKGEEGTGIASDVVKVLGADPDTRCYLRRYRLRRDIGDFQS